MTIGPSASAAVRRRRATRATLSGALGSFSVRNPSLCLNVPRKSSLAAGDSIWPQSRHAAAHRRVRHASASAAGRDPVQTVRRPLRQGRLPGRVPRAGVLVRLRVRGVRPHVRRLHAEGVRVRDRPAPPAGRRADARGLRCRAGDAPAAARCARRRSCRATSGARDRSGASTPSSRSCRWASRPSAFSPGRS